MQLYPYQKKGRDWLAARTRGLLADGMRLGKTPQSLTAAELTKQDIIVVLCPAIARPHWHAQLATWCPGYTPSFFVWSYETLVRRRDEIYDQLADLDSSARGILLILDEAHYLKNKDAKRTNYVFGKFGIAHIAERVWALTGTPITRDASDLYPLFKAFGVFPGSYEDFVQEFCVSSLIDIKNKHGKPTGKKRRVIWGTTRDEAKRDKLRKMFRGVGLRRQLKDVAPELGLEPRLNVVRVTGKHVDLPEGAETWADHPSEVDRESRVKVALAKIPYLVADIKDNLESRAYKQTVVFAWHHEVIDKLSEELRGEGFDVHTLTGKVPAKVKQERIEAFQKGMIQVLICNIATAGTAIDLSAANHGYFLEMDFVPATNKQASYRLTSLSKGVPSSFDVLVLPDSRDEKIMQTLVRRVKEIKEIVG